MSDISKAISTAEASFSENDDKSHAIDALLDSVFALMGDGDDVVDDLITKRPWVLCIDDDSDFSAVLTRRFELNGIGVFNACDGLDGCNKAFAIPADAIILDYNMPHGQGDYVLRRLKGSPVTRDIPVFILTGNRDDTVRRTMIGLGADAFLYKPVNFELLLDRLNGFIDIPSGAGLTAPGAH